MNKETLRLLPSILGILIFLAFQNGYILGGAILLIINGFLVVFLGHSRPTKLIGVASMLWGLYILLLLLGVLLHFLVSRPIVFLS